MVPLWQWLNAQGGVSLNGAWFSTCYTFGSASARSNTGRSSRSCCGTPLGISSAPRRKSSSENVRPSGVSFAPLPASWQPVDFACVDVLQLGRRFDARSGLPSQEHQLLTLAAIGKFA